MRVRVKVQHDRAWKPSPEGDKRYWVNLPSGGYFPVFQKRDGWHHCYLPHKGWPSLDEAIKDGLERRLHGDRSGPARYRAIRARERTIRL